METLHVSVYKRMGRCCHSTIPSENAPLLLPPAPKGVRGGRGAGCRLKQLNSSASSGVLNMHKTLRLWKSIKLLMKDTLLLLGYSCINTSNKGEKLECECLFLRAVYGGIVLLAPVMRCLLPIMFPALAKWPTPVLRQLWLLWDRDLRAGGALQVSFAGLCVAFVLLMAWLAAICRNIPPRRNVSSFISTQTSENEAAALLCWLHLGRNVRSPNVMTECWKYNESGTQVY